MDYMVSIYVPVYNHENYVVRALDSILMQETQYSYEVYVGEDCSTDRTREVLKTWEAEHPGKFNILYRERNMHNTDWPNGYDLRARCKGKYIICLEGDDYWTDPLKLEKQISFLESHAEYYAVAHNCVIVDKNSTPNGETYPECTDKEYTFGHFASNVMPGQLTTVLSRNYMTDEHFDRTLTSSLSVPSDRNVYFSFLAHGRVYCMQETMSAYRHVTDEGSSYSATISYCYEKDNKVLLERVKFAKKINNREAIISASLMYLLDIRYALFARKVKIATAWSDLKNIEKWYRYLPIMMKRDFNRYFTRKIPYV